MLILINNERLIDPNDISRVTPIVKDNPTFVPDIKTDTIDHKGNDQPPIFEYIEITYKNGDKEILKISLEDFIKELQEKTDDKFQLNT
jgi:hypothetical protein